MHCEFCDIALPNLAETRRHMLSIEHIRNKRSHDLNIDKYMDRVIQATLHPRNFKELIKLLNIHSPKDVDALKGEGFFKLPKRGGEVSLSKIMRELIDILFESCKEYSIRNVPEELREPLKKELEQQFKS